VLKLYPWAPCTISVQTDTGKHQAQLAGERASSVRAVFESAGCKNNFDTHFGAQRSLLGLFVTLTPPGSPIPRAVRSSLVPAASPLSPTGAWAVPQLGERRRSAASIADPATSGHRTLQTRRPPHLSSIHHGTSSAPGRPVPAALGEGQSQPSQQCSHRSVSAVLTGGGRSQMLAGCVQGHSNATIPGTGTLTSNNHSTSRSQASLDSRLLSAGAMTPATSCKSCAVPSSSNSSNGGSGGLPLKPFVACGGSAATGGATSALFPGHTLSSASSMAALLPPSGCCSQGMPGPRTTVAHRGECWNRSSAASLVLPPQASSSTGGGSSPQRAACLPTAPASSSGGAWLRGSSAGGQSQAQQGSTLQSSGARQAPMHSQQPQLGAAVDRQPTACLEALPRVQSLPALSQASLGHAFSVSDLVG